MGLDLVGLKRDDVVQELQDLDARICGEFGEILLRTVLH